MNNFGCKREKLIYNNCNSLKSAETTTTEEEFSSSELSQKQYFSVAENQKSSTSSSRKSYRNRRFLYSSKIIFFVYLIFMFLGTTHAITFFYGASGPEGDNDKTLRPFGELSYHEEEMEGPIPDITEDELRTVFNFCQILPKLEMMGRVRKSRVTQATCQRLIVILTPMFQKSSSNKPLI